MINWDEVACAAGCKVQDLPKDLVDLLETVDERIKDANGLNFGERSDFGLRSTQIIALIVLMWQIGIFNK